MVKYCQQCNKEFQKSYYTSKKVFGLQKFCGKKCFGESIKGTKHPHSEETKKKIGLANKNNKTGLENGKLTRFRTVKVSAYDKIGGINQYRNIHKWVEKQLGKPDKCSNCGKIEYGKRIHWANKSKEYRKEISDWVRLCVKCHYEFDISRKILTVGEYLY